MAHTIESDWPSAEEVVGYVMRDHNLLCRNFPHLAPDVTPQLPKKIVDALQDAGYAPRALMLYK